MTVEELEAYNENYTARIKDILTSLFQGAENRIKLRIQELYNIVSEGNLIKIQEFRQRLMAIQLIYQEMEDIFAEFSNTTLYTQLIDQYNKGVDLAYSALTDANIPIEARKVFDTKTLNIMVKDMISDFSLALGDTRRLIGSFYTFSKQGIVTETELTFSVARAMMETGYRRDAVKGIQKLLQSNILEGTSAFVPPEKAAQLTQNQLARYINQQAKLGKTVRQSDITKFLNKINKDGFIRIINKNGKEMYFRTSVYSEFVANTRLADSQVKGTIEQGMEAGVSLFQVTSHNSPNFCGEFERNLISSESEFVGIKYYHPGSSTNYNPNSRGWQSIRPLKRENIPTYHINCKHRLYPVVVTSRTIKQYQMNLTDSQREAILA